MAFFIDKSGNPQHVEIEGSIHREARDEGLSVKEAINRKYRQEVDTNRGTAFTQLCASEGIVIPGANDFGIRAANLGEILEGKAMAASPTNNSDRGAPFGSSARSLFPVAIIDLIETQLGKDRKTDSVLFNSLVAQDISIAGDSFIQPVIDYQGTGGPEKAKANRITEFAEPGNLLRISTSENYRSLPTFSMGIEYSDKAQRNLSIDVIAATIARYVDVERDQRVYNYLSALFMGDNDLVKTALSVVEASSFDTASTGGVLTHKAWVMWLASYRKFRRITHVALSIDTYLKIEGRTGRPGSNNYDPTLARIDPQIRAMSQEQIGFGNDVVFFLVDTVAEGGPIPAGEVWGIDASKAITRVRSTTADYQASEAFALRRSTAMRWDYGEAVYRQFGDTELRPFSRFHIT